MVGIANNDPIDNDGGDSDEVTTAVVVGTVVEVGDSDELVAAFVVGRVVVFGNSDEVRAAGTAVVSLLVAIDAVKVVVAAPAVEEDDVSLF